MKAILAFLFFVLPWPALGAEHEIYYILQKGFISIEGKTNFFDFQGRAIKHEGVLVEDEHQYHGKLTLHFNEMDFNLPGVQTVLEDKAYINAKQYPEVVIELENFSPSEKPIEVRSLLSLRGTVRPVIISTKFAYFPPVVKVEGSFVIQQSAFGIKPYKGMVNIHDELDISFKVFFCERHIGDDHSYHKNDAEAFAELFKAEDIPVLSKKEFFGCAELENKQ